MAAHSVNNGDHWSTYEVHREGKQRKGGRESELLGALFQLPVHLLRYLQSLKFISSYNDDQMHAKVRSRFLFFSLYRDKNIDIPSFSLKNENSDSFLIELD